MEPLDGDIILPEEEIYKRHQTGKFSAEEANFQITHFNKSEEAKDITPVKK